MPRKPRRSGPRRGSSIAMLVRPQPQGGPRSLSHGTPPGWSARLQMNPLPQARCMVASARALPSDQRALTRSARPCEIPAPRIASTYMHVQPIQAGSAGGQKTAPTARHSRPPQTTAEAPASTVMVLGIASSASCTSRIHSASIAPPGHPVSFGQSKWTRFADQARRSPRSVGYGR